MGLLGNVIGGVVASRMAGRGGPLGGALGGAVLGGMGRGRRGGSPVMSGLMLLLAAKAAQSYMERRAEGGRAAAGGQAPGRQGGGGGLLAGVAGGGGLGALVEQFTRAGHGDAVNSWIRPGPNQKLPPRELARALGPETVEALKAETGLEEDELLDELSETLPETIDQLTPDGVEPDPAMLEGDEEDMAIVRASSV
jgi:uncharacterized protein YidB (DUF937 family)